MSVNGQPDDAAGLGTPVGVQPGDEVRLVATGKMLPEALVIEGGDEVLPTSVEEWAKPSLIWLESSVWDEQLSVTGSAPRHLPKVVATTTITQAMCDEGPAVAASSRSSPSAASPRRRCRRLTRRHRRQGDAVVRGPEARVAGAGDQIPFGETVELNLLKGHALKGGEWRLDPMPAWLTASATSGLLDAEHR